MKSFLQHDAHGNKISFTKKTENILYVVSKYQINGTTDDAVYDMTRAAVSSLIAIAALRAFDDQRARSVRRFCCCAPHCPTLHCGPK